MCVGVFFLEVRGGGGGGGGGGGAKNEDYCIQMSVLGSPLIKGNCHIASRKPLWPINLKS